MLKCIMTIFYAGSEVVNKEEFEFNNLKELPVLKKVVKVKELEEGKWEQFEALIKEVETSIKGLK